MEAGMGRFELWVPGFRVITVELDRVIETGNHQAKDWLSGVHICIYVSFGIMRTERWAAEDRYVIVTKTFGRASQ